MYILSKQFSDKFKKLYTKQKQAEYFFRLKILVLSNNNVFSNSNISINIYPRSGYTDR